MALFLRGLGGGARVVIACVLSATWVALALLWTPAPPEPAPFASDQPGDVTSAISPVPDSRQAVNVSRAVPDANQRRGNGFETSGRL